MSLRRPPSAASTLSSFGSGTPAMQPQPNGSQLGSSYHGAIPNSQAPPGIAAPAAGPGSYSHFSDQYYYSAGVDFQAAASDFKPELPRDQLYSGQDSPSTYAPVTNIKIPLPPHGQIRSAASKGYTPQVNMYAPQSNVPSPPISFNSASRNTSVTSSSYNLSRSASIPRPGAVFASSGAYVTPGTQPITPDASISSVSSTSPRAPVAAGPDFGETNAGGGINGLAFNVDVSHQKTRAPPHHASSNRDHEQLLASYLSQTTFSKLLASPVGLHKFAKFLASERSSENIQFWYKVNKIRQYQGMLRTLLDDVQHEHMTPSAPLEVNIDQRQRQRINEQISKFTALLEHDIFTDAQSSVYQMMYRDSFQRFVKHQLALAAQRALASSRSRNFFGLGDCFCLTDPTINDNPIVLASDGFVAVTGYTRQEIVPFNCRFLQGELTDPEPVRRIREAIAGGQEVTELLVNYRKDGVPFWNLVFIAPLRASDGRIRFFLGGQIDVTSNLNREANINTVIFDDEEPAMSENEEALLSSASSMVQEEYSERGFVTWLKNIFSSKDSSTQSQRSGGLAPIGTRGAGAQTQIGAESNITQTTTMSNQISTFYNTYSKYVVLDPRRASLIFVSWQLLTGLNIPRGVAQTELIGHSLFNTIVGPNTRKSARKNLQNAYREGRAVTEAVVCHERIGVRRAGWAHGESGALNMRLHLTPLKDGVGRVGGFICVVCVLDDRNVTTQSSSGVDGTMTATSVDIGLIKYPEGEYRGQKGGNPYGGTLTI